MEIRIAEKKDVKAILPLFIELDKKHIKGSTDFKSKIHIDRYKKIFNAVFQKENNLLLTVSIIDNKIIGFVLAKIYEVKNNFVFKDQKKGEIVYIAINHKNKREGIGRKMIEDIEVRLKAKGASKIEIRVYSFNTEMTPEKFNYVPKFTVYEKF